MKMTPNLIDVKDATTASFIRMKDDQPAKESLILLRLKSSVLVIGIILGVALQSLSWTSRMTILKIFGAVDTSMWFDIFCTLTCLLFLPMIVLEMVHIALLSVTQFTSTRIDDEVFHKLLLHVQSRFGAGVLCGVLLTLPVLDFSLEL